MNIKIVCVGKIKEKFYDQAIAEYVKRLSRYCKLKIIEVADEKTPDHASTAINNAIKSKEGQRILSSMEPNEYVIALCIEGKQLDSVELSTQINQLGIEGKSNITFVIGGSLGLAQTVIERANFCLSFSKMTFPHQLMRVILLEQIYRAYKIIYKEPYHK